MDQMTVTTLMNSGSRGRWHRAYYTISIRIPDRAGEIPYSYAGANVTVVRCDAAGAWLVGLVLCGIAWTGRVSAQTVTATTGAVNGVVTDSTKAVVPRVTVTLSGPSLITART